MNSSPHPHLRVVRDGPVATVLIDRAAKRNALDLPMWDALRAAFEALSADDEVRCVIMRGAGDVAFSAGADIAAFAHERGTPEREERYHAILHASLQSIHRCRHPVVAAISGWCMGGGAGIASMCDFRLAGEGARIGIPARNLGIWYPYAELDPLLQVVGYAVMMELFVEGRVFTAREALDKGLVTRVVPDADVQAEARALARRICEGAPLSNRFHKAALQRLRGRLPVTEAEQVAANGFATTADFNEAVRAFNEKRRPVFVGR